MVTAILVDLNKEKEAILMDWDIPWGFELSFPNPFLFQIFSFFPSNQNDHYYQERQPTKIFLLQGELMAISWSVTELMQILKLNIHDIQLWNNYL